MSDGERSVAGHAWRAFVQGATRPSLPATLGTALVCGSLIGLAAVTITPRFLGDLALSPTLISGDPYAYATLTAFRAANDGPRDNAVAIFGASAQMQAFGISLHVERRLADLTGTPVPVDLVCAPGIKLPEMLTQIELSKDAYPGALVIGVSPRRIGQPIAKNAPCLGLVEPPDPTGIYVVDQRTFLLPRIERTLVRWIDAVLSGDELAPPRPPSPRPTAKPRKPKPEKPPQPVKQTYTEEQFQRELALRLPDFNRFAARIDATTGGLPALTGLLEESREHGRTVVLIESVLNPRMRDALDQEAWAHYRATMAALAEAHGAHYWDLVEPAGLRAQDFRDIGHIGSSEARERYSLALADRLAPLLEQEPGS